MSTAPPTVQLLIYARGTSKIPGSNTTVQGFLVLYHGVKRLRLQVSINHHWPHGSVVRQIVSGCLTFLKATLLPQDPMHPPENCVTVSVMAEWQEKVAGIKEGFHAKLSSLSIHCVVMLFET